jgi:hypothetical protein
MKLTCPTCHAQLQLGTTVASNQVGQCPKCGAKIRLAPAARDPTDDSSTQRETVHVKKQKHTRGKRDESFLRFALKAFLSILGLALLIIGGYIAVRQFSMASARVEDFNKKLSGMESRIKSWASKYLSEIEQGKDRVRALEYARAGVGTVWDALRKLEPPRNGQAWHDVMSHLIQRTEVYFNEMDKYKTATADEAIQAARIANEKLNADLHKMQSEVDQARRAFQETHGLK